MDKWLSERLDRMELKLDRALIDIATLKVKAGIWGGFGALIVAAIALAGVLTKGCV